MQYQNATCFFPLCHGFDNRTGRAQGEIKETDTVFEFLCIHHLSRAEEEGILHQRTYLLLERVGARHTRHWKSNIDFSGGILSMGIANVASSEEQYEKPMFQYYHGDGTSILRGPASPPVVRNSSVVLIMLISFFFFFPLFCIYCLFYRRGQRSAQLERLLSFGRSLAFMG